MDKLDRFDPYIEDEYVQCGNCSAVRPHSDMIFDERSEHFFCDYQCFEEWVSENLEEVAKYYYESNCGQEWTFWEKD